MLLSCLHPPILHYKKTWLLQWKFSMAEGVFSITKSFCDGLAMTLILFFMSLSLKIFNKFASIGNICNGKCLSPSSMMLYTRHNSVTKWWKCHPNVSSLFLLLMLGMGECITDVSKFCCKLKPLTHCLYFYPFSWLLL